MHISDFVKYSFTIWFVVVLNFDLFQLKFVLAEQLFVNFIIIFTFYILYVHMNVTNEFKTRILTKSTLVILLDKNNIYKVEFFNKTKISIK